jgi:hypothetical protein
MILFSAELAKKTEASPLNSTPSNGAPRTYNVYEIYTGPRPVNTYWTEWGGEHDNAEAPQAELYFSRYLTQVVTREELYNNEASFVYYIEDGYVYFNIPKHPWLYAESQTALREIIAFLSGPPRPDNPSDDTVDGRRREVRLETPSVTVKISDVISGLVKYSTFSFSLFNDDGRFDDMDSVNFFNSPAYLRKSRADIPSAKDFIPLRAGLVEDITVSDKSIVINCADKFRSLEEPVCEITAAGMLPEFDDPQKRDGLIGKELPVLYGQGEIALTEIGKVKNGSTKVTTYRYIILCGYVRSIDGLYTGEDEAVEAFEETNGVITVNVPEGGKEAKYALVSGYERNRIGEIITDLIERRSGVAFGPSAWDKEEAERYISVSAPVNILFKSGTVKSAITEVLKSDMAFLIQKNDGRFTLRRWGGAYQAYTVPSWMITQQPSKDFKDAQAHYFSSCLIKYNLNPRSGEHGNQAVYTDNEAEAEALYNKAYRAVYETRLTGEEDALDLAERLGRRFSFIRETVKLAVGADTGAYNILDTVYLDVSVNGRRYSKNTEWVIKELDPAQDKLVLESADKSTAWEVDGLFADTDESEYEYEFDGGTPVTDDYELMIDGGGV